MWANLCLAALAGLSGFVFGVLWMGDQVGDLQGSYARAGAMVIAGRAYRLVPLEAAR